MIDQIFGSLWALLYLAFILSMVLLVLVRKRDPSAALGWSLAIVLLPILGSALFLVFGLTRMPRRLRRKREHRHAFAIRLDDSRGPVQAAAPSAEAVAAQWAPLLSLSESLGEPPARAGNEITLLEQGQGAFERIFAAVRAARHHVHIEMYIFRDDHLGRGLLELLIEKVHEGVQVRLCVDYVGTLARFRLLRRLRKAGGEGAVFLPLSLWPLGKRYTPNLRNHRKLVVCDGEVAFFGGLNIGEEYLGRKKQARDWCDLHFEVRGPAVGDLQRVFVEDWDFATGQFLDLPAYFPAPTQRGSGALQVLTGGPDREVNPIRQAFFHAFTRARKRLWLASPYVVPDPALRDALKLAARAGTEVLLITQSWPPDNFLAELAGSYYFDELLAAKVRIFRYDPGMMHAKLVLADDSLAIIGSPNLDNRSLRLNFELAGLLTTAAELAHIEARFVAMLAQSTELTSRAYGERSSVRRVGEGLARLLAPLL